MKTAVLGFLAVGLVVATTAPASAVSTWNLRNGDVTPEPSGTPITTPASFFAIEDGAQLIANSSPVGSSLNQNSNGLGVTTTPGNCPNQNPQVDTCDSEYIVFQFPSTNWDLVSLTLTRLGGGDSWQVLGDTDSDPTGATLLAAGTGNTVLSGNPTAGASTNALANDPGLKIFFPGGTAFNFIFVQPLAGQSGDIKVAEIVGVPEPATLLLFGTGLVALVGAARRRR